MGSEDHGKIMCAASIPHIPAPAPPPPPTALRCPAAPWSAALYGRAGPTALNAAAAAALRWALCLRQNGCLWPYGIREVGCGAGIRYSEAVEYTGTYICRRFYGVF